MSIDITEKQTETLDKWSIIDTYFRDNPYYKSQHQIDSYDEFIYSKVNGIQHIIKRGNPLRIYKDPYNSGDSEYRYEVEIYFGEKLNERGELELGESIYVSSPTEYNNGEAKYMYPNIARLKTLLKGKINA